LISHSISFTAECLTTNCKGHAARSRWSESASNAEWIAQRIQEMSADCQGL